MKLFKILKNVVYQADFFSTTQLIRFQEQPQFKTFTGGAFSLAIMGVLAAIFFTMSLSAVNRKTINWSSQYVVDSQPAALTMPFSTFNIGVELAGFNLSAAVQYFDVVMTQYTFKDKKLVGNTRIPMSMCRRQDWAYSDTILAQFDRMNATNWLCPSVNQSFLVQGKWTTQRFTYLQIDVYACGTKNPNAVCANKSDIDAALANIVHYSVYYINSLILPGSSTPVTYFLQDKDYVYVGDTLGGANYIFISDYKINTDESILPYQQIDTTNGGVVTQSTRVSIQEVANGLYASFVFRKSSNRYTYTRSFIKFDTVVSYTGGLFGALIGVLFLMNHYTRTHFQVAIGSSIYNSQEDEPFEPKDMNIVRYLGYAAYRFMNMIGHPVNWPIYDTYHKCRLQVQKHLDIKFILDKLNFLQKSVSSLCGQDKFKAMHLRGKTTLKEAQKYRELYFLRPLIINSVLKRKKEKKQQREQELKEQTDGKHVLVESPSILQPSQPFFNIGKGKVVPLTPQHFSGQVTLQKNENARDQGGSISHNTIKFTKKTQRYIEDNKSFMSSFENFDTEGLIGPQLFNSLNIVKRQADNGDNLSQQIWNDLDEDVKMIAQRQFQRFGEDFIIQKQDVDLGNYQIELEP